MRQTSKPEAYGDQLAQLRPFGQLLVASAVGGGVHSVPSQSPPPDDDPLLLPLDPPLEVEPLLVTPELEPPLLLDVGGGPQPSLTTAPAGVVYGVIA
jgi:hypothetical protein